MSRRARAIGVAAACVVALAGCTNLTVDTGAPGGGGFHLAQVEHTSLRARDARVAVSSVDAPPGNATEWTVEGVDPTARRIAIDYVDSGSASCGLVDAAAVQETATTVVIGLSERTTGTGACADSARAGRAVVPLRRALGGRALMEAATGVNDGLPKVPDPAVLPGPTCSTDVASDSPAGMPDVAERMAPVAATKVFVCRTWWPKGSAHTESTTITDRAEVARLVSSTNAGATDVRPADALEVPCPHRLRGSWYDLYFEGPGLRVSVRVDEISCMTITNGAISGRITPSLAGTLDALFPA